MNEPLFYTPDMFFTEKTAGEVDLPDDPNQWPQQILQELYKQVPYITDYQPHVQMERANAERGYGLGHVEIQNQSEAPQETPQDQLDAAGIRTVRIPFIVREKKLSPFDLLINDTGAVVPLTENRLRQALFRPQAFDVTSRTPGDQSMIGQLYPPYRQNFGFGGGGIAMNAAGGMGIGKVGSAKNASILSAILPTLDEDDRRRLADEVNKEASAILSRPSLGSPHFSEAVSMVLGSQDMTKHAEWENWLVPDVVQIQKAPVGYRVKTASHRYWEPKEEIVDRGVVVHKYGAKAALEADLTGCCTMASGLQKYAEDEAVTTPALITSPGAYRVTDTSGQQHVGYVIPALMDMHGSEVHLSLFTNGSVYAVQSEIYGVPAGNIDLPSSPISQHGLFFVVGGSGIRATMPMELQASVAIGNQPRTYNGVAFGGFPIQVSVQDKLVDMLSVDDTKVLIPSTWKWLPLDDATSVVLVNNEEAESLHPEEKLSHVNVISDGISFSMDGVPLLKMAAEHKGFLDVDDAMFLLAGLGVNMRYGAQKLAEAVALRRPATVKVARVIEHKKDLFKKAFEKAAGVIETVGKFKQPLLVKEAASFPDPQTVDTVLSLGFINPENIMTFVSYLPDLEDVQEKLCELLFGVRVGLSNVPQTAVERAVRSTEEVIEGLKILGFQGS